MLRLARAAFDAEYQPPNGAGAMSLTEVTLMIRPPPWARMTGSAARISRIGPNTFTSNVWCASASPPSSSGASTAVPALLIRTSRRPAAATTDRTAASQACGSARSRGTWVTSPASGTAAGLRDA